MTDLKLAKLPDRKPVKMTVTISPELHRALADYAAAYEAAYAERETVADLIPFIIATFIENDRAFVRTRSRSRS